MLGVDMDAVRYPHAVFQRRRGGDQLLGRRADHPHRRHRRHEIVVALVIGPEALVSRPVGDQHQRSGIHRDVVGAAALHRDEAMALAVDEVLHLVGVETLAVRLEQVLEQGDPWELPDDLEVVERFHRGMIFRVSRRRPQDAVPEIDDVEIVRESLEQRRERGLVDEVERLPLPLDIVLVVDDQERFSLFEQRVEGAQLGELLPQVGEGMTDVRGHICVLVLDRQPLGALAGANEFTGFGAFDDLLAVQVVIEAAHAVIGRDHVVLEQAQFVEPAAEGQEQHQFGAELAPVFHDLRYARERQRRLPRPPGIVKTGSSSISHAPSAFPDTRVRRRGISSDPPVLSQVQTARAAQSRPDARLGG